jgi:hypothetical protein
MTSQEVIDRAYSMVADTGGTKRNSTADMIGFLNDGIRDLLARRPELSLNADGTVDAAFTDILVADIADAITAISDDQYREQLAHYIAYRIFEIDAEDENNARMSQTHYQLYIRNT